MVRKKNIYLTGDTSPDAVFTDKKFRILCKYKWTIPKPTKETSLEEQGGTLLFILMMRKLLSETET